MIDRETLVEASWCAFTIAYLIAWGPVAAAAWVATGRTKSFDWWVLQPRCRVRGHEYVENPSPWRDCDRECLVCGDTQTTDPDAGGDSR